MDKGEREVRERKGRGVRRGEGEKGGNGSGPDQVREENDARVHTPTVCYFEYKNNRPIASRLRVKLPTSFKIDKLLRPK